MKHIPDVLWCELERLLPKKEMNVGRPEFDNRKTFEGIIFVLKTGVQWHCLPAKYGCPTTIHGKYMRWARDGVFGKMIVKAREYYRRRNSKNNWYAFDTISKKAPLAQFSGNNPTDGAKKGIKHSILVDRKGAPMYINIAPANTHDSHLLNPILSIMRRSKQVRIKTGYFGILSLTSRFSKPCDIFR